MTDEIKKSDQGTHNLLVSNSIIKSLPAMVKDELSKMSANKQEQFVEEFKRKKKSLGVAYLLMFIIGGHYAYLGKIGMTILFLLTGGGLLVWFFIDLFRLPGMVKNHNKDMAMEVMRNLKTISN